MLHLLAAISTLQFASLVLIITFLFLGFKLIEMNWSYRISKPHLWEEAVRNGEVSRKLKKIERFFRDKVRFYVFWFQIRRLQKEAVEGSFAELGVYRGETAAMIHEMDSSRRLHLFDTFEGFAKQDLAFEKRDDAKYDPEFFADTSEEIVKNTLGGNENVIIHKGYFPETATALPEERYAFVHLDADLYKPTLDALQYFYPRLSAGGVIIIHDYNHDWEGPRKAIAEFLESIPERLTELPDWQGSVLLVKNRS